MDESIPSQYKVYMEEGEQDWSVSNLVSAAAG